MNKFTKFMFETNVDASVDYYKTDFNTSEVMKEIRKDGRVVSPKYSER